MYGDIQWHTDTHRWTYTVTDTVTHWHIWWQLLQWYVGIQCDSCIGILTITWYLLSEENTHRTMRLLLDNVDDCMFCHVTYLAGCSSWGSGSYVCTGRSRWGSRLRPVCSQSSWWQSPRWSGHACSGQDVTGPDKDGWHYGCLGTSIKTLNQLMYPVSRDLLISH